MNIGLLLIAMTVSVPSVASISTFECTTDRDRYETSRLELTIVSSQADLEMATLDIRGAITRTRGGTMKVSDTLRFDHLNGDAYSGKKFAVTLIREEESDDLILGLHWLNEGSQEEEEPSSLGRKIATFVCRE